MGHGTGPGQTVAVRCPYPIQIFHDPRDTEYLSTICGEHSAIIASENVAAWANPEPEPTEIPEDRLLAEEQKRLEALPG